MKCSVKVYRHASCVPTENIRMTGYIVENKNRDRTAIEKPGLFDTARTSQSALFNPDWLVRRSPSNVRARQETKIGTTLCSRLHDRQRL